MKKLFLIKATNGKEATMSLPVDRHQGITTKGFKLIHDRFSSPEQSNGLKYALNLEAFSNATELMDALKKYQSNVI